MAIDPASGTATPPAVWGRPTIPLPMTALVRISLFWLGLTSIDAVVGAAVQSRVKFDELVEPGTEGTSLAASSAPPVPVQRRGPADGRVDQRLHDRAAGAGASRSSSSARCSMSCSCSGSRPSQLAARDRRVRRPLLSFSTNIARGPFQGYVPDLVPDHQVGLASAMVGLMQILGNVTGFALAAIANSDGQRRPRDDRDRHRRARDDAQRRPPRRPNGPPPKPREGRSWLSIAAETWGTDILRERSYIWLLASRLFILMGGARSSTS